MSRNRNNDDLPFEEVLGDDWSHDLDIAEVPIGNKPMLALGIVILGIVCAIMGRVIFLNFSHPYYTARAEDNMAQSNEMPAPVLCHTNCQILRLA